MASETKRQYLLRALELAKLHAGECAPNPAVGCVLVKDGVIIGEGYHLGAGTPHAEVNALANCIDAKGSSAFVSLEPCCHYGRTPPCTEALIAAGVAKVYYGFADPDVRVSGKSSEALKAHNINSEHIYVKEIAEFYRPYQHWQITRTPYLIAKLALSLDGKIALCEGARVHLSGDVANKFTHTARKESDAILTSVRTINNDDPELNVRMSEVTSKPIYILDKDARINPESKIFRTARSITLLHHEESALPDLPVYFAKFKSDLLTNALYEIMAIMGKDGMQRVWVEAGGALTSALWQAGYLQEIYLYITPHILGESAYSAFIHKLDLTGFSLNWQILGSDAILHLVKN